MTIIEQVTSIMKHVPATRSDDKLLCITYMQLSGMKLSSEQEECFKRMPSLWSVRRQRQAIQEQGLYPATDAVNEERYKQYKEHREDPAIGNHSPALAALLEGAELDDVPADVYSKPVVRKYVPLDWNES